MPRTAAAARNKEPARPKTDRTGAPLGFALPRAGAAGSIPLAVEVRALRRPGQQASAAGFGEAPGGRRSLAVSANC